MERLRKRGSQLQPAARGVGVERERTDVAGVMEAARVQPRCADELLRDAEQDRAIVVAGIDRRTGKAIDALLEVVRARLERLAGVGADAEAAGALAWLQQPASWSGRRLREGR